MSANMSREALEYMEARQNASMLDAAAFGQAEPTPPETPDLSGYSDEAREYIEARQGIERSVYEHAIGSMRANEINTAESAQTTFGVLAQSQRAGVTPEEARAQIEQLADAQRRAEFRERVANSPAIQLALARGVDATAVRHDLDALTGIEWLVKAIGAKFGRGFDVDSMGEYGFDVMLNPDDAEARNQLSLLEDRMGDINPWLRRPEDVDAPEGGVQLADDSGMVTLPERQPTMLMDYVRGLSALATDTGTKALLESAEITASAISSIPDAAIGAAIGAAGGALMRSPKTGAKAGLQAGYAYHSFKVQAGHVYLELERIARDNKEPIERELAIGIAATVGSLGAGLDLIGAQTFVKASGVGELIDRLGYRVAGKKLLEMAANNPTMKQKLINAGKKFATVWSVETLTETLQEVVAIGGEEVYRALMRHEGRQGYEPATPEALLDRVVGVIDMVGHGMLVPGMGAGGVRYYSDSRRAEVAQANLEFLDQLGQATSASQMSQAGLSQQLQTFVEAAQAEAGGPVRDIYLQADVLREVLGVEQADAIVAAVPSMANQSSVFDTGGDFVIPLAEYTAHIAGTDYHAQLMQHARTSPTALSAAEALLIQQGDAAALEAGVVETLRADVQEVLRVQREQAEALEEARTAVREQLASAGVAKEVADAQAVATGTALAVFAQRSGTPVRQLLDAIKLRVQREQDGTGPSVTTRQSAVTQRPVIEPDAYAGDYPLAPSAEWGQGAATGNMVAMTPTAALRSMPGQPMTSAARAKVQELVDYVAGGGRLAPIYLGNRPRDRESGEPDENWLRAMAAREMGLADVPVIDIDTAPSVMPDGSRVLEQPAYHGTPHLFDPEDGAPFGRFSLQHLGRGEGQQAFGWGLYLAERRGTAEHYQHSLASQGAMDLVAPDGTTLFDDLEDMDHAEDVTIPQWTVALQALLAEQVGTTPAATEVDMELYARELHSRLRTEVWALAPGEAFPYQRFSAHVLEEVNRLLGIGFGSTTPHNVEVASQRQMRRRDLSETPNPGDSWFLVTVDRETDAPIDRISRRVFDNFEQAMEVQEQAAQELAAVPDAMRAFLETLEPLLEGSTTTRGQGHLYTVEVADDAYAGFVNYNALFKDQPPIVQAAFHRFADKLEDDVSRFPPGMKAPGAVRGFLADYEEVTGGDLMEMVEDVYHSQRMPERDVPRAVSMLLESEGVSGLKFLDSKSRYGNDPGPPTYNLVVWNEDIIRITERDGEPVPDTEAGRQLFQGPNNKGRLTAQEIDGQQPDGDHPGRVSQRLPTAKSATEDPVAEKLTIGVEQVLQLPPVKLQKVADMLRGYVGFMPQSTDPEGVIREYIEFATENLLAFYDAIPEETRVRSMQWYDGARRLVTAWSARYQAADTAVAAIMAALSPQKDWFTNVSLAERVLDIHNTFQHSSRAGEMPTPEMLAWVHAKYRDEKPPKTRTDKNGKTVPMTQHYRKLWREQRDAEWAEFAPVFEKPYNEQVHHEHKAVWMRAYDEAHNPGGFKVLTPEGHFVGEPDGKVAWNSYNEIGKAVAAIENPSLENITRLLGNAHKVRNFYNNILAPNAKHGDVTIDTHAVAAALWRALSGESREVKQNFGASPSSTINGQNGTYGILADAYRLAASRRGILPRQMQSITWEAVRGLFEADWKKIAANVAAVDAVWESVERGELDIAAARAQILKVAGDVNPPEWSRAEYAEDRGDDQARDTSYGGELGRLGLGHRRGARGLVDRSRTAVGADGAGAGRDNGAGTPAAPALAAARRTLDRADDAGPPAPYARRDGSETENRRGYLATEQAQRLFAAAGVDLPPLFEAPDPAEFTAAAARAGVELPALPAGAELFTTMDDTAGVAVADGAVVALFVDPATPHAQAAHALLAFAVQRGGTRLADVDPALANAYAASGFVAYADGDVVSMEYTDEGRGAVGEMLRMLAGPPAPPRLDMSHKDVTVRTPVLQEAIRRLQAGELTVDEYVALVRHVKPVHPYTSVPAPTSVAVMESALTGDKVPRIGAPSRTLDAGAPVGLRLDIPAYRDHGAWIVTVHEQAPKFAAGHTIGYESVASVTGATLGAHESAAAKIAGGHTKAPIAVIKGAWQPMTPTEARARAEAALSDPAWVQVGMDPERASYFYDRRDVGAPIVAAEEVIQVGPLVLAKNPTYGERSRQLFQPADEGPRGSIDLPHALGDRATVVTLMKDADPSTFLHEMGHLFLELQRQLADRPGAEAALKADWAIIQQFLGAESGKALTDEQHEKFARAFEAYLMEGKAPTEELRGPFDLFRQWLLKVYQSLQALNVEINDELRGVFDRMFVAQAKTDAVNQYIEAVAAFSPAETARMSPGMLARYEKLRARAAGAAEEHLRLRLFKDMERKRKKEYRERRNELVRERTAEVARRPVHLLRSWVTRQWAPDGIPTEELPRQGIDADTVARDYGEDRLKELNKTGRMRGIVTKAPGLSADEMALFFGFESGADLLEQLATTPNQTEVIKGEVKAALAAEFPDLMDGGQALQEAALEAAHNEYRAQLLELELRHLMALGGQDMHDEKARQALAGQQARPFGDVQRQLLATEQALRTAYASQDVTAIRRAQELYARAQALAARGEEARKDQSAALAAARAAMRLKRGELRAISSAVKHAVARMTVRQLSPAQYERASIREGRAALAAIAARDYTVAAEAKYRQLVQYEMARQVRAARTELESKRRALIKAGKSPKPRNNYREQIRHLLETYELHPISVRERERRQTTRDFVEQELLQGNTIAVPRYVLDRVALTTWQDITVEEARGVHDAVKSMQHLGRLKDKLRLAKETREREAVIGEMQTRAVDLHGVLPGKPLDTRRKNRLVSVFQGIRGSHLKPEFIMDIMDGGRGGPWWTHLFRPIADAAAEKAKIEKDLAHGVRPLVGMFSLGERLSLYRTILEVPELPGVIWTKQALLSLAMNMGNEGNIRALEEGYGWSRDTIMQALNDRLSERDWRFVQGMIDVINTVWPRVAELQRRLTGIAPEKVEASPIQTKFGTIAGGYYPLKYDPRGGPTPEKREAISDMRELFGQNALTPTTRMGHTQERVGSGGQKPQLDLGVGWRHLNNVAHDLAYREAVQYVHTLLQDQRVREGLEQVFGEQVHTELKTWLFDTATDRQNESQENDMATVLRHFRTGATMTNMGFKFTTMAVQVLGYTQSAVMIGPQAAMDGLWYTYGRNAGNMGLKPWREAASKSDFVRTRFLNFDRDIREFANNITDRTSLKSQAAKYAFAGIGLLDMAVVVPTWWGAYRQAIGEGKDDATAIAMADSVVRMSQSSGAIQDLARIQRGSEFSKLFTMFYSYFSTFYNLMVREGSQVKTLAKRGHYARAAGRASLSFMMLVFVPAIASEIMLGRYEDDDDEMLDEEFVWWALKKVATYPFLGNVFTRDIANMVSSGFDAQLSPLVDVAKRSGRLVLDAVKYFDDDEEGREAERILQDVVLWTSYVTGVLPGRQLWLSGDYLHKWMDGDVRDFNVYDFLVSGAPRE